MARKATPEEKYIEAMNNMLVDDGLRIEEITATKVQNVVGGQYSKIVKIVSNFKDDYLENKEVEKTAPLSPWFKELVENITHSVSNQMNESWFTVNTEISSSIAKASEVFEGQKAGYEEKSIEDLEQIRSLEDENEKLVFASEEDHKEIKALKNKVSLLMAENNNKDEKIQELKMDHKDLIQELKGDLKALQSKNTELNKNISVLEVKNDDFEKKQTELDINLKKGIEALKQADFEKNKLLLNGEQQKEKIAQISEENKVKKQQMNELKKENREALKELKIEIKQLQENNISLNKTMANIDGQLQIKNEIIAQYEKKTD